MKILFLVLCMCSFHMHAQDMNQIYQEGKNIASSHANDSIAILKALDITQLPGYTPTLPQENYYKGVTQKGTDMEASAMGAVNQNDMANAVTDSFNNRSDFKINTNSETFRRLDVIAANGDAIMNGQDTEQTKCVLKPEECIYSWEEKKCLAGKKSSTVSCNRTIEIDLIPWKTESYSLYIRRLTKNARSVTVNLLNPDTCNNSINCYTILKDGAPAPPLVTPQNCSMVKLAIKDGKGQVLSERQSSCASPSIEFPAKSETYPNTQPGWVQSAFLTVEIYEENEFIFDSCISLRQREVEGFCRVKEPLHCIEPNETRVIENIPYTRACWREKAVFSCGGTEKNTCEDLIQKGCEQSSSTCKNDDKGQCNIWEKTYQCPVNNCTKNQLVCGKDTFCLDGDCDSHNLVPADESEFKKAVSILSAATEGAKDLDVTGNFVFKGKRLECSRVMLGAKNCCHEKGWGIDMNLFHCSDEEKQLGKARENRVVIPTGEYCFKRQNFPGGSVCVDHHQTYCVFQSRLARIVQEQGRRNQLGIGFGEGEFSNCTGLTPGQLQMIQFERIDFSEFYEDIRNRQNNPDYNKTARKVSERIKDFYAEGDDNA